MSKIMIQQSKYRFVVMLVLYVVGTSAGSVDTETNCDANDVNEAFECTGLPTLRRRGLDYSQVAQQVCRANKSKEVEDCIDWLNTFYDCQHDEFFQFVVQTDHYLEFIDFFCSQSEVYVENGLCIGEAYAASQSCSEEAMESIGTEPIDAEEMSLVETFAELCRSLLVIISCHTNAVEESCGDEAATFVDKYWQFQMHYCYNATTSTSLSTQVGTTTQLHLLDSITQETSTSQESIMQGTTTTQESITQGTATSQESITQGQATSQEGITQGPATSQEDTTQGTATSQEGITQGPATSQEGITQGSVTSQEGITQGAATSQESFNGSAGVRQFIALLILFLHCSLKNI